MDTPQVHLAQPMSVWKNNVSIARQVERNFAKFY